VPGSPEPVATSVAAARVAGEIGYPVILKAAAGGGGIGMAKVASAGGLAGAFATATRRAQSAFGSAQVYVERYLAGAAPRRGAGLRRHEGQRRSICTSASARSSGVIRSSWRSRRRRTSRRRPSAG